MKRTTKKLFALLLVLAMLLSLAACKKDDQKDSDTPKTSQKPKDTDPSKTDPQGTEPGETDPAMTDPTDPEITPPAPTDPQVTAPPETTPQVTAPPATTPPAAPLTISKHPDSQSVSTANATVKFTVSVSGGTAPYKYQWYTENDKQSATTVDKVFTGASGVDSATVSLQPTSGKQAGSIWCVITDAAGKTVTSNKATLKVNIPLTFTKHPGAESKSAGQWVTFTVKVSGGKEPYLYWWYTDISGKETEIKDGSFAQGAHKNEVCFFIQNSDRTGKVWCKVMDANGKEIISQKADLNITNPFYISMHPSDVTVPEGERVTFYASGAGGTAPYTYQWYCKTANGEEAIKNGGGISGAKTGKLVISKAKLEQDGMKVWCVVTDASGATDTSAVVTLTVRAVPAEPPATTPAPETTPGT